MLTFVLTDQFAALEASCCSGYLKRQGQQRKAMRLPPLRATLCCLKHYNYDSRTITRRALKHCNLQQLMSALLLFRQPLRCNCLHG